MLYSLAIFVSLLLVLMLLLLFLGLPGIWAILAITGCWAFFVDAPHIFSFSFFIPLIVLAAIGEVVEFFAGYYGTKKFGGTSRGGLGGIIGGFIGAILGAPLLFGFGAVVGAFAGAFAGCLLTEIVFNKMQFKTAVNSAWGTTLGRMGGLIVKLGIGIWILFTVVPAIVNSAG